jgi:hypothetical protein
MRFRGSQVEGKQICELPELWQVVQINLPEYRRVGAVESLSIFFVAE